MSTIITYLSKCDFVFLLWYSTISLCRLLLDVMSVVCNVSIIGIVATLVIHGMQKWQLLQSVDIPGKLYYGSVWPFTVGLSSYSRISLILIKHLWNNPQDIWAVCSISTLKWLVVLLGCIPYDLILISSLNNEVILILFFQPCHASLRSK